MTVIGIQSACMLLLFFPETEFEPSFSCVCGSSGAGIANLNRRHSSFVCVRHTTTPPQKTIS